MFDSEKTVSAKKVTGDITDFIVSFDTPYLDLCDEIVAEFEAIISNKKGTASYLEGSETHRGVANRKDESLFFHTCSPDYHIRIHSVLAEYTPKYGNIFPSFSMQGHSSNESKVQRTMPKGGFHTWHAEHGIIPTAVNRTLAWTFYLNDIPEGEGETEFLEFGAKVQPKKGRLCYFPAGWTHTHRGNPVYTTTKYIATGWYQFA